MEIILIGLVNFYFLYIIFLLVYMFNKRKAAIRNKEVHFSRFKTYQGETTEQLQAIKNHIENQFQIPIIFFIACLFSIQQGTTNAVTVTFACVFVASRLVHSFVHLGSNHLIRRAFSYLIGLICVAAMLMQCFISSISG